MNSAVIVNLFLIAGNFAKRKAVLQEEEDDCLSLLNHLVSAKQPDNVNHKQDKGMAHQTRRTSQPGNQGAINAKMPKIGMCRTRVSRIHVTDSIA